MTNKPKRRKFRVISTKRNKGLEPLPTGVGIIGYNEEIHDEDSLEFTYKLPLGAIKRLITSYYDDIRSYDEENIYLATSSSSGLRGEPYCYRMLSDIGNQLDKHGLNGKKIDDEIFDNGFKAGYEKMKRFNKNHGFDVMETFKPCNDTECCNYTDSLSLKLRLLRELFKEALFYVKVILINRSFSADTKVSVSLNSKS
ncbi:hypothetical protein A2773_03315 [Candidatus Gottesmanbacteria bacterium RIFCSPHIGHO2_01_FULL_39_10]|uniref:Uncharacterized protein n=1 Tax=Candidatus Gottesmanbacteria bacterium RIFCSPHIGHO2_01_FULL_39_10 TaxID=1798375 RepID=A0A1F5ZLZ3_9BACT|nr:MAG: hypothetical protein A2773_03315 [Candidatus Gottesmanbacteria bacterium RIFCSPHIGHO2_01_FULL_39_10]